MTWKVKGQDHLTVVLEQSLTNRKIAHAYLFVGPPQVGKETLAINVAQALNCTDMTPPCGYCVPCKRIDERKHADVSTIRRSSESDVIHRDQILDMQHSANLPPYEGNYRVYIIDGAESLSTEAANALLKNLEEPVLGVIFLLLTENEELVLPTIRSRCRRMGLRSMKISAVEKELQDVYGQDMLQAQELAGYSQGCLGRAVDAIFEPSKIESWRHSLDLVLQLERLPLDECLNEIARLADRFGRNRSYMKQVLGWWEELWMDMLLIIYGLEDHVIHKSRVVEFKAFSHGISVSSTLKRIELVRFTKDALETNANLRLALETLALNIGQIDYDHALPN
jgi:DNA polymerase-3 subunit delta'